jgi:dolichol-phosphate mannosyltransferase
MSSNKIVIIPTLNEAKNIEELVNTILTNTDVDILVVDDDSTDGTEPILNKLKRENERFDYLIRKKDHGYGKSCLDGFHIAIKNGYEIILTMDADLSHPPIKINELVNTIDNFAMSICSRYIKNGKIETKWSFLRKFLSKFGSSFARVMLRIPVFDCTSGFRCYKSKTLVEINYQTLNSDGYALLIEIVDRVNRKKLPIKEIPFIYTERKGGKSKLSKKIIFEAFFYVIKSAIINIANFFRRSNN